MYNLEFVEVKKIKDVYAPVIRDEDNKLISLKTISALHNLSKKELTKSVKSLILQGRLRLGLDVVNVKSQLHTLKFNTKEILGVAPDNINGENIFVLNENGYKEVIEYLSTLSKCIKAIIP